MIDILRMIVEHATPLKPKGNVASTSNLPTNAKVWDMYNIGDGIEGDDYFWFNGEWNKLSSSLGTLETKSHASNTYAPKASPTLTGTPKAPTAAVGTDTTQIATTAFVQAAIQKLITDYGLTLPSSGTE